MAVIIGLDVPTESSFRGLFFMFNFFNLISVINILCRIKAALIKRINDNRFANIEVAETAC